MLENFIMNGNIQKIQETVMKIVQELEALDFLVLPPDDFVPIGEPGFLRRPREQFHRARFDLVVLTHAHIDHSGYLPRFVRHGFAGPVYATPGTRDLCGILLPDAGHLQEEEARYANAHGYSKHKPALPLYTEEDARASLSRFEPLEFRRAHAIASGVELAFLPAGHILGASIATLQAPGLRLVFSGDASSRFRSTG